MGKKVDLLIQDIRELDQSTGLEILEEDSFIVWADAGLRQVIEAVEGVYLVLGSGTKYVVQLDARYDREWAKREVEAAILCSSKEVRETT